MEKNYYNILGLDANKDINYSIKENDDKNGYDIVNRDQEIRDKKIKDAYEKQYKKYLEQYQTEIKELDDEYEQESKKLEEKYEKSIAAKKLILKKTNNNKENTAEKIMIKLENEIKEYDNAKKSLKDKFEQKRTEIFNKYKSYFEELMRVFNDELKTQELREIYQNELDKQNVKKSRIVNFETAYDFFRNFRRKNTIIPSH